MGGVIGATNYVPPEGLDENRTLNRESFDINTLFPKLDDPRSHEGVIYRAVQTVLTARASLPHFDRSAPEPEKLLQLDPAILAVVLRAVDEKVPPLLIVINVANETRRAKITDVPEVMRRSRLNDVLGHVGGGSSHQEVLLSGGLPPKKTSMQSLEYARDGGMISPGSMGGFSSFTSLESAGSRQGATWAQGDGLKRSKSGRRLHVKPFEAELDITLGPYEVLWLKPESVAKSRQL